MSEQNKGKIKETAEAFAAIAKEVPVYQDALQPAAKEVGKGLETIAKSVNVALAPLEGLVWGYEKIKLFFFNKVTEKLKNIPEENIVTPPLEIAGPTIEAMRFAGLNEELSEMYANLLATSMDTETVKNAHPSYVEILKQLSSDEAKILKYLSRVKEIANIHVKIKDGVGVKDHLDNICKLGDKSSCTNKSFFSAYIDNLERLGLIVNEKTMYYLDDTLYQDIMTSEEYNNAIESLEKLGEKAETKKGFIKLTALGKAFVAACVQSKDGVISVYPQNNE